MTDEDGHYDLPPIYQGSTFHFAFVFDIGGELVDVTNYQARMQIRRNFGDAETLVSIDDTSGIVVGGEDGSFDITITDEQTADLDFDDKPARYDFEIESTGGEIKTLFWGRVGLRKEVTRVEAS